MKYVLVTGGVVSGLGKGVTASSIGVLLKSCGLRVTSIKIGESGAAWAGAGGPTRSQLTPTAPTRHRSLSEHRRRHDVALRARRGVCAG